MRVVIRPTLAGGVQVPVAAHGVVHRVLSAPKHGTIFLVRLESGEGHYFIWAELRKAPEGEDEQFAAPDRPRD